MTYPVISSPAFVDHLKKLASDDSKSSQFSPNAAQAMMRGLMGCKTPYRGMLLFHALGTGKTCAAIGVAESVLACRNDSFIDGVVVMLAASLEDSFISEIINTCGNLAGSKWVHSNGHWSVSDHGTHYQQLNEIDQQQVKTHIRTLVHSQYDFWHFNGLTKTQLKQRVRDKNPFDNKLVIFDEVHNLTKSVVHGHSDLHATIFKLLLTARNCKIVALSATPMVNDVSEIGFLISMLRGISEQHQAKIHIAHAATVMKLLQSHPCVQKASIDMRTHIVSVQFVHEFFQFGSSRQDLIHRHAQYPRDNAQLMQLLIRPYMSSEARISIVQNTAFPLESEKFKAKYVDAHGHPQQIEEFANRVYGYVSFFQPSPHIFPSLNMIVEKTIMSQHQCDVYVTFRQKELRFERKLRKTNKNDTSMSMYRSYSRRSCDFAFPTEIKRYFRSDLKIINPDTVDAYDRHVNDVMHTLTTHDMSRTWLVTDLPKYSAKYSRLLHNLSDMPALGTALIYSEFRNVPEGIPVICSMLDANGYEAFDTLTSDPSKHRYLVYDPNYTSPSMQQLLYVFNNQWHLVDHTLKKLIESTFGHLDNLHGRIIRLLIISASASEGVSLKNVRQVHVMQSYWQNVRIEQVIGRARRAYSHAMLPVSDRNVRVFLYVTTMSPDCKARALKALQEDVTSDEHVFNIARAKSDEIARFSTLLQRAAIDCPVWNYGVPCMVPAVRSA